MSLRSAYLCHKPATWRTNHNNQLLFRVVVTSVLAKEAKISRTDPYNFDIYHENIVCLCAVSTDGQLFFWFNFYLFLFVNSISVLVVLWKDLLWILLKSAKLWLIIGSVVSINKILAKRIFASQKKFRWAAGVGLFLFFLGGGEYTKEGAPMSAHRHYRILLEFVRSCGGYLTTIFPEPTIL